MVENIRHKYANTHSNAAYSYLCNTGLKAATRLHTKHINYDVVRKEYLTLVSSYKTLNSTYVYCFM